MERTQVVSSNILSVGYDGESKILEIEFKSLSIYHFFDVPTGIYVALMAAPSVGKYFNIHIKNHFRYTQIK